MQARTSTVQTSIPHGGAAVDLRGNSCSPDEPLALIAATASRALGAPLACVYICPVDGLHAEAWYGPQAGTLQFLVRPLAKNGSPAETLVVSPHDELDGELGGDGVSVTSYVVVPIRHQGETAGLLCVADYRHRHFKEPDVRLAEDFAALAAAEIRTRRERHLISEREERFRAVAEHAQDVAAILDCEGEFTYVSPAAGTVFDVTPEETVGRSLFDGVVADDLEALRTAFETGLRDPEHTTEIEFRVVRSEGDLRHLRMCGRNLFHRPGVRGFLATIRDVTERIRFEDELLRSRYSAEEMSRLKSAFLTNMSHEIRTPLTTILGFAEILVDEVEDEQREFVELIQKGGERLLDTLTSILDLARLESKSFDLQLERLDVCEKIREVCRLIAPLAEEKGIDLTTELPAGPVYALVDVSAIERIVTALVSNGIKFTTEGRVSVSMEADEEHVLIHVADSGIGISEEFMPFLFEEFKQESEGLSRMHEGSGLGLSITKRLVELMNGDIMAESEKGRGSVFTIAFPRDGEDDLTQDATEIGDAARPCVLVVEDNADTRTLVHHLLRKSYDVVCASSAEEAISMAEEKNYDVLLVDINLGKGKSGEEVLHAVKAQPKYQGTPVIAVTAYAMPGDRERFFSEGFDDYVAKPFSKQRLLEALESASLPT